MLRLLVLVLLLSNGLFFVWSQGLLQAYGWAPAPQTEPQRLHQQVRPETLRLLSAEDLRRQEAQAAAPPPRPPECLQAGLFNEAQATLLRTALATFPVDSWTMESGLESARWIVYMGRYVDAEAMNKKRGELRSLNIRFEPLVNPALEPGLSLGSYPTEAAARDALAQLANRGVRTARVLQERAEARGQWLKFPQADEPLKQRLGDIKTALVGRPLRTCR